MIRSPIFIECYSRPLLLSNYNSIYIYLRIGVKPSYDIAADKTEVFTISTRVFECNL